MNADETPTPIPPEYLRPVLRKTEEELTERLQEVCEVENATEETTAELIRLEEKLEDAAKVTKQAISLRRRARVEREQPSAEAGQRDAVAEAADATGDAGEGVRDFRDSSGAEWRVWAVVPHRRETRAGGERLLGEYVEGWLAFEAAGGSQRKRLPHYPADWTSIPEAGLRDLLERAEPAPHRARARGSDAGEPPRP